MSATNGMISDKMSFRTLVGSGSSEHDFDGGSMIVFCMSAIEHVANSSNTAAVDSTEDITVLPFVALRTVTTFSSKKTSSKCCADGHVDDDFIEFLEPIMVARLRQSFFGWFFCSSSRIDQKVLSFCR